MNKNIIVQITLEHINAQYTDYMIFKHLFNTDPNKWLNRHFSSPFRVDIHPSCNFFYKNNHLYFVDWQDGVTLDPIAVIMKYKNLTFQQALNFIVSEIPILDHINIQEEKIRFLSKAKKEQEKEQNKSLMCSFQNFTELDKEYLVSYGINRKTCERLEIRSVKELFINNNLAYIYSKDNPAICYTEKGRHQIYLYKNKGNKFGHPRFYNNTALPLRNITRLDNSKDHVILTKSMKDVALLTRLKYNAVSVKSESTVDIDFLHSLKFQNKYILFDFDITGAKLAHQITLSDPTWQIKYVERTDKLYLPSYTKSNDIKFLEQFYNLTKYKQETIKGKDISDYCFHNGLILTKKKCQIMFT